MLIDAQSGFIRRKRTARSENCAGKNGGGKEA